ncbi:unnamed protein product [Paramecium sonneborni]|uniref:Uncharacterized protein n=1 Tax=Paramecium sonneborni TaxID=65129 RepID=A0A8S1LDM6_9CILI|nr:unnamed protein product [Paramecium sonneborni]
MQNSEFTNVKFRFNSFVVRQPQDYSRLWLQRKTKKKLKSPIAFGSSQEKLKGKQLPTLPDYDINYSSVEPNSRKAIITKCDKTKRSLTEISRSSINPLKIRLPELGQQQQQQVVIKPCMFQIKEYTPKMYDVLPYTTDQLKECFKNLLSKHKIKKPDQNFII